MASFILITSFSLHAFISHGLHKSSFFILLCGLTTWMLACNGLLWPQRLRSVLSLSHCIYSVWHTWWHSGEALQKHKSTCTSHRYMFIRKEIYKCNHICILYVVVTEQWLNLKRNCAGKVHKNSPYWKLKKECGLMTEGSQNVHLKRKKLSRRRSNSYLLPLYSYIPKLIENDLKIVAEKNVVLVLYVSILMHTKDTKWLCLPHIMCLLLP